jgi:putative restriction endonuclease
VHALQERHDALTVERLTASFQYQGRRIPVFNPQCGIFKPRRMRYLLSVRAG